jgi:hypothetical protein
MSGTVVQKTFFSPRGNRACPLYELTLTDEIRTWVCQVPEAVWNAVEVGDEMKMARTRSRSL